MARSVEEWIGKTDDERAPPRIRQRIFDDCGGKCHICDNVIVGKRWALDHVKALVNGGENRQSNLKPVHIACHAEKTAADVAEDDEVVGICKESIRNRLSQIEEASYRLSALASSDHTPATEAGGDDVAAQRLDASLAYESDPEKRVQMILRFLSALRQPKPQAVAVPDGWWLVPVKLPDEMASVISKFVQGRAIPTSIEGLNSERDEVYFDNGHARELWNKVVSASPLPSSSGTGWRPIETAPKDGTRIIVKAVTFGWSSDVCQNVATGDKAVEGRWAKDLSGEYKWLEWCGNDRTHSTDGALVPLGWLPLPAAPVSHGGGRGE